MKRDPKFQIKNFFKLWKKKRGNIKQKSKNYLKVSQSWSKKRIKRSKI